MSGKLRGLLQLLQRGIVSGGDVEELWGLLLGTFSATCGALTQSMGFGDINSARDIPESWARTYQSLRHTDPFAPRLLADQVGTPNLIARDSAPAHRQTELWRAFKNAGFADGLNARLYNPFVPDLFCILYRERGRSAFDDDDRILFRLIYPHLASGLAAKRALAAMSANADETLAQTLTRVAGHVYVSLPAATVIWSANAREFWARRAKMSTDAEVRKAEQLILGSAFRFHGVQGGRSQVVFPGIRIEWASVPAEKRERRRLLGLMLQEGPNWSDDPSPVEALLSPRQRRVARLAATGASVKSIAYELAIKETTVRGYVREVYERLGISTRAQLATLLAQRATS